MISNSDPNRSSSQDRRKKSYRPNGFNGPNGFDRRLNGNGERAGGEDTNGQDDIFTTEEACRYLKVSRPTYMKCIASGKIKAKKVGRGWRALKSELKRFLCAV